ncbi:MAG TPA: hypothetical protein VN281_04365 [Verrucomicrobiae bacterium]|jgi:hypothetical protein|nr:hypothetical protein [Verrucomicrobiae bacterium]
MIPQTQNILQSYFQTGDVPNQAQYLELIGTMFYYISQLNNSFNTAQTLINNAVTAIQQVAPQVIAGFNTGSGAPTLIGGGGDQTNVASVTFIGPNYRITFTTPFGNATYKPICQGCSVQAQTANYLDVSALNNVNAYVLIWK